MEVKSSEQVHIPEFEPKGCENCKINKHCKKIFSRGDIKNAKLIFILNKAPKDTEYDVDVAYSIIRIQKACQEYGYNLRESDIAFVYAMPTDDYLSNNQYWAGEKNHKKREKVYTEARKHCKDNIFAYIARYARDDAIIVPVGKEVLESLYGLKSIIQQSGKVKERNYKFEYKTFVAYKRKKGGREVKRAIVKKLKTIPLLSSYTIKYSVKYKLTYEKTIRTIAKELAGNVDIFSDIKTYVLTPEQAKLFLKKLLENKDKIREIAFDTETTALEPLHNVKIIGVSITPSTATNKGYYIPIQTKDWVDEQGNIVEISESEREELIELIRQIVFNFKLIGHNIKFDIFALYNTGIIQKVSDIEKLDIVDTRVLAHLKVNKSLGGLSLKHLAKLFFDVLVDWDNTIEEYKEKLAKELKIPKSKVSYALIPTHILGKYAGIDTYYTWKLYEFFKTSETYRLTEQEWKLAQELFNQVKAVASWEAQGTYIDNEVFEWLKSYTKQKVSELKNKLKTFPTVLKLFSDFNPNSNIQLGEVIRAYKIPNLIETESGNIKVDKDAMEYYLTQVDDDGEAKEFIQTYIEYKFYEKALSSYVNRIPKETDEKGIFRTSFTVVGTATGRLSSYYHTLPSRTDYGKNFKRLVKARSEDRIIVFLDISQAEPRTLASLSEDDNLIQVYRQGKDIYKYIASIVYNTPYDEVTKDVRNQMKALVLALTYGMSPATFAQQAGISEDKAKEVFELFFNEFKKVKKFIENRHKEVDKYNSIRTPLGRTIPIIEGDKSERHRKAQNYIIQSTASELCLIQFSTITLELLRKYKARVLSSVHDSLVIESPINEMLDIIKLMKFHAEQIVPFKFNFIKVPFKADLGLGVSWGRGLEVDEFLKDGFILSGYREDLNLLMQRLENYYTLSYEVIEEEQTDISQTPYKDDRIGRYKLLLKEV